jgi:hypothetical protein
MKTIFLLLILITFQGNTRLLHWSKESKLKVSDFKCIPPKNALYSAQCSAGIYRHIELIYLGYKIHCNATFDQTKSWIIKAKSTPELLRHEQGHFDISQIGALEALITIKKKIRNDGRDVFYAVDKVIDSLEVKCSELNRKYDFDTQHSLNKSAQLKWEEWINSQLDSLSKIQPDLYVEILTKAK